MSSHDEAQPCTRRQPPRSADKSTRATTAAEAEAIRTVFRPGVVTRRPKFQATVEEYDSDSSLTGSAAPSPSMIAGAGSAPGEDGRTMPDGHGNLPVTPPSSRPCSPRRRQRPSVHFSKRHPVVLHHRTDDTSSSSSSLLSSSSSSSSSVPSSSSSSTSSKSSTSKRDSSRGVDTLGQETPFLSVVDRQWGVLFTEKGEPTTRLGEVLRGMANYIIREYKPSASLITPGKLSAFYRRYRLEKEPFPLDALFEFDSRQAPRNLELLYQDLSCEYHLIPDHHHHQNHHRTRPSIPALTPTGFQTWLTLLIQASPSCESHRLCRLLLDVPLEADASSSSSSSSSSSATPERLPAQLSRYLLPAHRNEKIYSVIASALDGWYERTRGFPPREVPVPVSSSPSWSTMLYDALRGGVSSSSSSSSSVWPRQHKMKKLPAPTHSRPEKRNHRDVDPHRHESIILPSVYAGAGANRPRSKHHGKFATFTLDEGAEDRVSLRTRVSDGKGPRAREFRTQPAHDTEPWPASSSSRRVPYPDERTHRVHIKEHGRYSHREEPRTVTYRSFLRDRLRA